MDLNLNTNTGASNYDAAAGSTQTNQTTGTTAATTVNTPTVTGPPVDNMVQSEQPQTTTPVTTYTAPTQNPQLPKPKEGKEEVVKHDSGATQGTLQDQPVDQPQVQQQDQEGQGQEGGQDSGSGADTGSGQEGSPGSFEGGSQGNFQGGSQGDPGTPGDPFQGTINTEVEVTQTTTTGPTTTTSTSVTADETFVAFGSTSAPEGTTASGEALGTVGVGSTTATAIQASVLYSPPTTAMQMSQNVVNIGTEFQALAEQMVALMKEGPEKFRFADFLSKVGDALRKVQSLLQDMQMKDTAQADKLGKAQLDMHLNQIARQNEEMNKMFQKQMEQIAKQATMAILGKIFAFLIPILIIVMLPIMISLLFIMGPLAALALALLAAEWIDCCAQLAGKPTFAMQGVMNAITVILDVISDVLGAIYGLDEKQKKTATELMKFILMASVLIMMVVAAMPVMIFGGIAVITDIMSKTHLMGNLVKALGGTEKQAADADTYTALVVGAVFAIAGIAVCLIAPEAIMGPIMEIVNVVMQFVKTCLSIIMNFASMLMEALASILPIFPQFAKAAISVLTQVGATIAKGVSSIVDKVVGSAGRLVDDVASLSQSVGSGAGTTAEGTATGGEMLAATAEAAASGAEAGVEGAGAAALQAAGKMLSKGAQAVIDVLKSILKKLLSPEFLLDATTVGVDVFSTINEVKMYRLKADLVLLQAGIDADFQLTEAHIKILKKVIQDLLDSMAGFAKELANVAQLSKKIISGQSNVLSNLMSA